ncbi:MAG: hypothetical protein MR051_05390 [Lentisphaeria bacterium]|nr:hypothetical protein [Lentisphaeria bacterium]
MRRRLTSILLGAGMFAGVLSAAELRLDCGDPAPVRCGEMSCADGTVPEHPPAFEIQLFPEELRVAVEIPHAPDAPPAVAGTRGGSTAIFGGETAEVMVAPDGKDYFHFAMNPEGRLYAARGRAPLPAPAAVTGKARRGPGYWRAEFAIPYQLLGAAPPRPGQRWRFNAMASTDRGGKKRSFSWSAAKDFHDPARFGTLHFADTPGIVLRRRQVRNETLEVELVVPAADAVPQLQLAGHPEPGRRDGKLWRWQLPIGGDFVVPKYALPLTVTVNDGEGKTIFSAAATLIGRGRHTLELDKFYYGAADKTARFRHDFPLPARLVCRRAADETVCVDRECGSAGTIDLSELAPGANSVEIHSGKRRTSRTIFIAGPEFILPPASETAELEIVDGKLHVGGVPVFAVGASSTPRPRPQFTPAFNLASGDYAVAPDAIELEGLGGVKLIRRPGLTAFRIGADWTGRVDAHLTRIAGRRRAVRRLAYEAQFPLFQEDGAGGERPLDPLKFYPDLYRKLKARHPRQLLSIHSDESAAMPILAAGCDILECAFYSSSFAEFMMEHLERDARHARHSAGGRPVLLWLGGSIPDAECRLAEELRCAAYCAMLENLNGVMIHMGHGGISPERTRLWSLISGIGRELAAVYPFVAEGEALPFPVKDVPDGIRRGAWRRHGDICLILINRTPEAREVTLDAQCGPVRARLTPWEARSYFWRKTGK